MKKRSQRREIIQRFMKNKAAVLGYIIILVLAFCALFPQLVAPYGFDDQELSRRFTGPCAQYIFGTDNFGRDIFSRVVYGCRTSLMVGTVSVAISCVIGTVLGCVSAFYGRAVDNILMRLTDIMLAIPKVMLAISIVAAMGASTQNLIIAIAVGTIPSYARIIRASVLSVKEQEYVEAAHSIGANDWRIMLRHIMPNCAAPVIVQATMNIAEAILSAAGLSFIGLGVSPPLPEWGSMLSAGREFMRDSWYVVTFPGLAIMITVFAFNLFGDGLRDALDPKLKN